MNLKLKNLSKSYNGKEVLSDITIEVEEFQSLAIVGPSGGGKSTLIRILAGLEKLDNGTIEIDHQVLDEDDDDALRAYRRDVGIVFQAYNLFPHLTALENVMLPLLHVHNYSPAEAREKAIYFLERFKLKEMMQKTPGMLSGGQQQRVAIVRALTYDARFFFFDEPTSALDPELTVETLNVINELKNEGKEMILVTHQMGFARSACDYTLFLAKSKVLEAGPSVDLFTNPKSEELRLFLDKILEWN